MGRVMIVHYMTMMNREERLSLILGEIMPWDYSGNNPVRELSPMALASYLAQLENKIEVLLESHQGFKNREHLAVPIALTHEEFVAIVTENPDGTITYKGKTYREKIEELSIKEK